MQNFAFLERPSKERKERKKRKKERKSIHPLNINTFNNHYNPLNECDNIRKMLKSNCMGKAPSRTAIGWKVKGPYNMKYYIN